MCKEYHFDSLSGLEINTWCGIVDSSDSPVTVCDIDDQGQPKHYVQIRNSKTLNRKVVIKGIIQKRRAKFEGDPSIIKSETQWSVLITVSGKRGLDTERFSEAIISKRNTGDEQIKVEVEYFDLWDSNLIRRADEDVLEFRIRLV